MSLAEVKASDLVLDVVVAPPTARRRYRGVPDPVDALVPLEAFVRKVHLLDAYGAKSDLKVDCVKTRARVNQALAVITSTVQPHYFKFFKPRFFEQKKPTSAEIEELEKHILGGLQQLLGDGKYAVGDKLTVADLSLVAHLTLPLELLGLFDASKFPKLASYYERLKAELPYFEEINRPGIVLLEKLSQDLK